MKAVWKDKTLAQSTDTVVVEGNHYFPKSSLSTEYFEPSNHTTHCAWKGEASYYNIIVDGDRNENAAWYYPDPSEKALQIKDRVAFWKGVKISE